MDPSPINWADKAVELVAAAILTLMGFIMTLMNRASAKMSDRIEGVEEKCNEHNAQIRVYEAQHEAMKETLTKIEKSVARVHRRIDDAERATNSKLDQLISRGG